MAIKDVSLQYAAMFLEAAEEEKKYEKACQEACKAAEEAKEKAIDEFDAEEIDPSECGFTEADVECNEVVDPLQMWKDLKKDEKGTVLVPVDNNYINTMKKLLSKIKVSKKLVYDRVMMKLAEYMKNGTKLPAPEDYAENFIPFDEIAKVSAAGSENYDDAVGAFGNDMADQNLWDNEITEADEKEGIEKTKKACEDAVKEVKSADVEEAKEFLEKNKANLEKAVAKIKNEEVKDNVNKIIKAVEKYANGELDESMMVEKKNSNAVVQFIRAALRILVIVLKIAPLGVLGLAKITGWLAKSTKTILDKCDKGLAENLTLETCEDEQALEEKDAEELDETGCAVKKEEEKKVEEAACQNEEDPAAHLLDPVGVKASTASLAGQDAAAISVVESLLKKIDKLESLLEAKESEKKEEEKVEEAEEVSKVSESQYDETQAARKLTYEDQLKFKRWAMRKLGLKDDPFYFDYVTGVDAKTSEDLPGLTADGSMTWGEGVEALKKHFNIREAENPDDAKTDDFDKAGDEYEEQKKAEEELKEADDSFEDDGESDADKPVEKSSELKRAEAIQAISFERKLTQAEEDEFRGILAKLSDYEKDLLLGNLNKTGFARPGNHTGMRAQDDAGNSVEIPAFNNMEDPEDHSQKKSIMKRQQKAELARDIQNTQTNALSSIDNNLNVNADISQEDWQIALGTMKNKEKKALMNELIDDIEAEYAGKDDAESQKAREDEIWYVWKIFGYDPKTRDLGKAWKCSHLGAGKKYNRTIAKMADAFRVAGVRKIADIGNVDQRGFKKMIDFLEKAKKENRDWKLEPKKDTEALATTNDLSTAQ